MKREELASSMMASAGYDAVTRTLEIEFLNGAVYQYSDVPDEDFRALLAAPSKGRFFHSRIQRAFRFRRVGLSHQ